MFLIAHVAQGLARWDGAEREEKREANSKGHLTEKFSQDALRHEEQESKMAPPIFIGRWTPKVLFSLKERPYRHGQLRRYLGSVSQRMLTRTLRNLESTGLITGGLRERRPLLSSIP